jgi:hypothetical protein
MRDPGRVAAWIKQELEQENQAYTFIGGLFVERMTPQEVESLETALKTPIEAIREHFSGIPSSQMATLAAASAI